MVEVKMKKSGAGFGFAYSYNKTYIVDEETADKLNALGLVEILQEIKETKKRKYEKR